MVKTEGSKDFTEFERELLISMITDYMIFRVRDQEIINLIEKRTGRKISGRTLSYIKKEINRRQGTSQDWLNDFAMSKMADFYRTRIEEVEYIQKQLLLIFEDESIKTEKKNKYLMNQLAKTIGENSKILADFGMAPPIVSHIRQMLPVDINDLNSRLDKQKALANEYLKDNAVDITEEIGSQIQRSESPTIPEVKILDNELSRLLDPKRKAKSGFSLPSHDEGDRGANQDNTAAGEDEDQRIF